MSQAGYLPKQSQQYQPRDQRFYREENRSERPKSCVNANNPKYQPHRMYDYNNVPPRRLPMHILGDGQSYECDDCYWKRKMDKWEREVLRKQIPPNKPQLVGFDVKAWIVHKDGTREEYLPALEVV